MSTHDCFWLGCDIDRDVHAANDFVPLSRQPGQVELAAAVAAEAVTAHEPTLALVEARMRDMAERDEEFYPEATPLEALESVIGGIRSEAETSADLFGHGVVPDPYPRARTVTLALARELDLSVEQQRGVYARLAVEFAEAAGTPR